MSYRWRILVINNLVESSLRQTFDGVDAPNEFLVNIQRELVNFSWDNYHWTHQSILFLPKEEGGRRSRISKSRKRKSLLPRAVTIIVLPLHAVMRRRPRC